MLKMEVDTRGRWPQAKGLLGPPKLEEEGRSLPWSLRGARPLQHLDVPPLASRAAQERTSAVWSHPAMVEAKMGQASTV